MTETQAAPRSFIPVRRVLGLGLVAGYVDALGFIDLGGVYTAAMTGNTTQFGISIVRADWGHLQLIALTLGSFFGGGLVSSLIRRHLRHPPIELLLMAALLAVTQTVRWANPHLISVELPLLAVAMAMQGETVSRFGGLSVQTIVVTNTILKFADALVGYVTAAVIQLRTGAWPQKSTALVDVLTPGTAWLAYTLGAGGGAAAARFLFAPFLVPIIILALTSWDLVYSGSPDAED